jgi:cell division protease FtsH
MVTRWGMSERLGTISFSERDRPFGGTPLATGSREYSEKTASMIDEEVSRIVSRAYNRAVSLMPEHRETLDRIAQALRAIMEEAGVPVSALA